MKIDLRQFDKQNMWLLPGGDLAVRPGLRGINYLDADSGTNFVGGKSVRNPNTGEMSNYFFRNDTVSGEYVCVVSVMMTPNCDEAANASDQNVYLPPVPLGSPITVADVDGQMVIAAPGMPTLWGYTGGPVGVAEKNQTANRTNLGSTVLDVPSGLCTSWAQRCVIADGRTIYISDALEPKAFGADNILILDGFCYGLFTSPNGALIMCTNKGVYQFSADAAASDTVIGFIEKVSDFATYDYKQTCLTKNGLWGITEKGFARIETSDQQEVTLADKHWSRTFGANISAPDWREVATIHDGQRGPIISFKNQFMVDIDGDGTGEGAMYITDIARGFGSWWRPTKPTGSMGNLIDILHNDEGVEYYLCSRYAAGWYFTLIMPYGNYDYPDASLTPTFSSNGVVGNVIGHIRSGVEESPVIDSIKIGSDTDLNSKVALNTEQVTATPTSTAAGAIIGTDTWGGGKTYRAREISTRRAQYADRLDDIVVEIEVEGSGTRLAEEIEVLAKGYDKRRP